MEDFEWEGTKLHPVKAQDEDCHECYFVENNIDCTKVHNLPHCRFAGKPYIFVETSQNALQQEQEASS